MDAKERREIGLPSLEVVAQYDENPTFTGAAVAPNTGSPDSYKVPATRDESVSATVPLLWACLDPGQAGDLA